MIKRKRLDGCWKHRAEPNRNGSDKDHVMAESKAITLPPGAKDLSGMRFGRWTAVKPVSRLKRGVLWECLCECGNQKMVSSESLKRGESKSCGCFRRDSTSLRARTHGRSGTKEHRIWCGMITRCRNPRHKNFQWYGALGISVCKRWSSGDGENSGFSLFLADMGECPPRCSLDRIDPYGDYSPENCRWADSKTQALNKRK